MFWNTKEPHGLPHNPFKSCVVPRPIGWITSKSADGHINLAPFSFFNAVSDAPPMVLFCCNGRTPHGPKDTITNVEATKDFVYNMVPYDIREEMNHTATPLKPEEDEFEFAGLETEPSVLVDLPRVKESPIHFECTYLQTVDLPVNNPEHRNAIVVGRVLGVHIRDEVLTDGMVDILKVRPVARMGYQDYTSVTEIFRMQRPKGGW
jgi:flavin reductase (DIM6/NTAB) family NADH-FMN oxidoreductase RutF